MDPLHHLLQHQLGPFISVFIVLCSYKVEEEKISPAAPPTPVAVAPAPPVVIPTTRTDGRVIATPYAKKLAKELKV